jgi:hypothetical protein
VANNGLKVDGFSISCAGFVRATDKGLRELRRGVGRKDRSWVAGVFLTQRAQRAQRTEKRGRADDRGWRAEAGCGAGNLLGIPLLRGDGNCAQRIDKIRVAGGVRWQNVAEQGNSGEGRLCR